MSDAINTELILAGYHVGACVESGAIRLLFLPEGRKYSILWNFIVVVAVIIVEESRVSLLILSALLCSAFLFRGTLAEVCPFYRASIASWHS